MHFSSSKLDDAGTKLSTFEMTLSSFGIMLDVAGIQKSTFGKVNLPSSCAVLLSSLELSDTHVYDPSIRALVGTASHFCESVVLNIPRSCYIDTTTSSRLLRKLTTLVIKCQLLVLSLTLPVPECQLLILLTLPYACVSPRRREAAASTPPLHPAPAPKWMFESVYVRERGWLSVCV